MYVFLAYLILINSVTFIVRGIDKYKARKGYWRIAEKNLLLLVAVGGVVGAFVGMSLRRHKTLKGSFLWKFRLLGILWLCAIVFLLYHTTS